MCVKKVDKEEKRVILHIFNEDQNNLMVCGLLNRIIIMCDGKIINARRNRQKLLMEFGERKQIQIII